MNDSTKKALIEYLAEYVTVAKREQMERVLAFRTRHVTVILEDIFQEHNASAVARTCDIFGVQDLHLVEKQYEAKLINGISRGSEKWLTINRYSSIVDCIQKLKADGYKIIATVPKAEACSLYDLPLEQKVALMFGTESTGLTKQALDLADGYMVIPMHGFTESFNVSVTVALCLQHIINMLHKSSIPWQLTEKTLTDLRLSWYRGSVRTGELLQKRFLQTYERSLI